MRLSQDKARQLSRLVWRERARRWLPLAAAAVVLFGVFTAFLVSQFSKSDRTVEVTAREGTVVDGKRAPGPRGAAIVHVHLDDGRDVDVFSTLRVAPAVGTHVIVNEARHASGRLSYDLSRLVD
jgi:hypothetical protein